MLRSELMRVRSSCRAVTASSCSASTPLRLSMTRRSAPVASTAWPMSAASVSTLYDDGESTALCRTSGEASTKRQSPACSQAETSQPSVAVLARRSAAGSSSVTKTPGCPRRTPSARNCAAKTVLALPA
jgi:hypothetical protein